MDIDTALNRLPCPKYKDSNLNELMSFMESLKKETLTISFCGTFKSGKSSLINSLLGIDLLPTRSTTATAVITKLYYSEQRVAYIIREYEKGKLKKESINLDDVPSCILLKDKSLNGVVLSNIKEVCIGMPLPLLKRGIIIVDTPGLDDDSSLTEMTMQAMNNTDLAVIVYNASKFMSYGEKHAVSEINDLLGGNAIFVINKMDTADDKESIIEAADYYLSKYGNSIVGRKNLIYTSAGENKMGIAELKEELLRLCDGGNRQKLMYNARINILYAKLETGLNQSLNTWEEYRAEYEKYEKAYADYADNASKQLRVKMMQLSTRLNNVRYNLANYLNPFKQMCISVAQDEGLLKSINFNSSLLAECIEKTNAAFANAFLKKLKKLFDEFSIEFSMIFIPKTQVTSSQIKKYLNSVLKTSNNVLDNIGVNLLGNDMFSNVKRIMLGENSDKCAAAYIMAVEDEVINLKNQINTVLDETEKEILKYCESNTPTKSDVPELQSIQKSMQDMDYIINWYRTSVSLLKDELKNNLQ